MESSGILFRDYDDVDLGTIFHTVENEDSTLSSLELLNSDSRYSKRVADDLIRNEDGNGWKRIKHGSELNIQGKDLDCSEEKGTAVHVLRVNQKMTQPKKPKQTVTKQNRRKKTNDIVSKGQLSATKTNQKASNFAATKLKIGSWEAISRREGDLVAKCYFAKRKLVWEILEGALKKKIEMQWSDIIGIRSYINEDEFGILEIELKQRPLFFREINPQPKKHTIWEQATDFTGGQALNCRLHTAIFPPKVLEKHYERILQCDEQLLALSKKQFPSEKNLYFDHQNTQLSFSSSTGYPMSSNSIPIPNYRHYQQQYVSSMPVVDIDFGQIEQRGTNNMLIGQTPNFPSQQLASEVLSFPELFAPSIEQNYLTPDGCDFDYYNKGVEQNDVFPSNYYSMTNSNIPNSDGVQEFGNLVYKFQPRDFDDYSNYYSMTSSNIPNSYGAEEFVYPVPKFQPQDFGDNRMA